MLATVRPRDLAGKTRRRLAAEQLAELVAVEKKMKKATAELKALVARPRITADGPARCRTVVAARILADVGDVARFADRNRFASWTGTAPIDASSGEQVRHRLSRAGNRRMNHMIHIAATSQIRLDTPGRAYYRRKLAARQDPHRSHALPQAHGSPTPSTDSCSPTPTTAATDAGRAREGTAGRHLDPARSTCHPHIDTSDQPLPGPATTDATTASPPRPERGATSCTA